MPDTAVELNPNELSPMLREFNEGLMVRFINADLIARAGLDVKGSIVLYDEDQMFTYATAELPSEDQLQALHEKSGIHYWSKGC